MEIKLASIGTFEKKESYSGLSYHELKSPQKIIIGTVIDELFLDIKNKRIYPILETNYKGEIVTDIYEELTYAYNFKDYIIKDKIEEKIIKALKEDAINWYNMEEKNKILLYDKVKIEYYLGKKG